MKQSCFFCSYTLIIILCCTCFTGCKSFDINTEIKSLSRDHNISESEFIELQGKLKGEGGKYEKFSDPEELYKYIVKSLDLQKISAQVWNPKPEAQLKPFNVNVYLENSASMDGYVEGVTDFENTIYEMLANIKTNNNTDSLNLNYINKIIPYHRANAKSSDIKDFIKNLDPATFNARGGSRYSSDLAVVIETVLDRTNPSNASVLISDFVFSPGSGANAQDYLKNQNLSVNMKIKEKLKKEQFAIAIYQLKSDFNGPYFDLNDKPTPFKGQRPYYIWIVGTEPQVKSLLNSQVINNANKGLLEKAVFKSTEKAVDAPFKLVMSNRTGDFRLGADKDELQNPKANMNGEFGFSVAVNFGGDLRGDSYFLDPAVYQVGNNYTVSPRLLTEKERSSPALKGFTHLLLLRTKQFTNQDIDIAVESKSPSWVENSTSLDDTHIKDGELKTFGLKYLIDGVSEGFNFMPTQEDNVISKIRIKIK